MENMCSFLIQSGTLQTRAPLEAIAVEYNFLYFCGYVHKERVLFPLNYFFTFNGMKLESITSAITARIGHALAEEICASHDFPHALVIALSGELGAGKTTFVQGFMKGLGVRARIQSPTFVLWRAFSIPKKKGMYFMRAIHVDAYRLKSAKELEMLGFRKELSNPRAIIILEWPGKVKRILPKEYIMVDIQHRKRGTDRSIMIQEINSKKHDS